MRYEDDSPEGMDSPVPGAQPQGAGEVSTGAPPSNTAPASCTQGVPARIIRPGVDSPYLSYAGEMPYDLAVKLQALKEAAQSPDPRIQAAAVLEVGNHRFEVRDRGSRMFSFVLADFGFFIALKGLGAKKLPLAHVQVSSALLLSLGVEAACRELDSVMAHLGQWDGNPSTVSRADICADFIPGVPLDAFPLKTWVTRARDIYNYSQDREISGYVIGQGGDISARLYDKVWEIRVSGKEYWKDAWRQLGWWDGDPLWRLEFQLRRRVLAEHGITTVADLLNHLGAVWAYATQSWLRLTEPSETDTTQTRWPLHPAWAVLSGIVWGTSQASVSVPIRRDNAPGDAYLFLPGLSSLTSFMAREGITEVGDAFLRFQKAAEQFHYDQAPFTGQDLGEYLRDKAAVKARSYGLPYPGVGERSQEITRKAYADEYRKRKDGE